MGNTCCSDTKNAGELAPQGTATASDKKTDLLISDDVDSIVSNAKGCLPGTFIPKTIGGNSCLLFGTGGTNDPKKFVRFFLISSFYISKYTAKDTQFEEIFYRLAKKTHPSPEDQGRLTAFRKEYEEEKNNMKKSMIVVRQSFSSNFLMENINQILLSSDDPKHIGHLVFPLSRIFNGIRSNFHESLRTKKHNPIYIIASLGREEAEMVAKMKGEESCFSFSVFTRGFTSENKARTLFNRVQKEGKDSGRTAIFFTVNFKYSHDKMESKYDHGFYINPDSASKGEGDVIFNIMNTFKVVESFSKSQYDLQYGYLPYIYYSKYTDRSPNIDTSSLRVLQLCSAISSNYLKSQSCLFRIIKEQKTSLKVSQSIIEKTQQSSQSPANLTEVQVQNLINNYIDDQRYDDALKLAEQHKGSYLIKAKKLEALYKGQRYDEAKRWLSEMGKDSSKGKISQGEEIVEFISARLLLQDGMNDKAKQKLRQLQTKMIAKYEGSYEIIGADVIALIQELFGNAQENRVDESIVRSQREARQTIERSQLNMRGISTTI